MSEQPVAIREQTVELPVHAPLVRVTAGVGSAGQKTWNLRRPVTVIGSRRPAHIVLHDQDVSNAHCVIVNTGTDVLVRDLHTSSGTLLNKKRVDLAVLSDGDVLSLGETNIQIAIQVPENAAADSGCGMQFADPARFPNRVKLNLMHTEKVWHLEEAVVLIGRHDDAPIRLDHPDISARHAIVFRFGKQPAVFDLGSRTGIWVNGQRCSLTPLQNGDRLTAGPFGLAVNASELPAVALPEVVSAPAPVLPAPPPVVEPPHEASPFARAAAKAQAAPALPPAVAPASAPEMAVPAAAPAPQEPTPAEPLGQGITQTWEQLNSWRTQLRNGAIALEAQQNDLAAKEAELDARDAALRGQLHDVTRFHEQITVRERELAAKMAQMQAESDVLEAGKRDAELRDADLARRDQEAHRREQALAQRWARLAATRCPTCKKPINIGTLPSDT
jgi:pSer/pThr/pTyr-binding forkhead associated (FHA) protein